MSGGSVSRLFRFKEDFRAVDGFLEVLAVDDFDFRRNEGAIGTLAAKDPDCRREVGILEIRALPFMVADAGKKIVGMYPTEFGHSVLIPT